MIAEESKMEEELLKRNTDCVYFLASPFTCNKGIECEYRHNEMARLNSMDCWYWKSGSCLNPSCGFRHPPLEFNKGATVGAAAFSHLFSVPPSKYNVPCYYFFSGYCNKGNRCPFMHAPDDTSLVKTKLHQEVTNVPASYAKTTATTESSLLPRAINGITSEKFCKIDDQLKVEHVEYDERLPVNNVVEPDASRQTTGHGLEVVAPTKLDSLFPPENLTKVEPSSCSDESSEELVDDCMEGEEWLESSPGFDVLVNENTAYEDEDQYLKGLEMNDESIECRYVEYEYDQMNYDRRILLEDARNESSVYSDDEQRFYPAGFYSLNSLGRRIGRLRSPKRKFPTMELPADGCYSVDLRHHLGKRRMTNRHLEMHVSRRHNLSHKAGLRQERLLRHGSSQKVHRRRLASREERNGVALPVWSSTVIISAEKGSGSTCSRHGRSRRYYEKMRKPSGGKVPRRLSSKQKNYVGDSFFAGPKSLAQIKEEKSKSREDGNLH